MPYLVAGVKLYNKHIMHFNHLKDNKNQVPPWRSRQRVSLII